MLPNEIYDDVEIEAILGALGLAGETGEVVDTLKKFVFHKHPLDKAMQDKIIDEMGDVFWYFTWLLHVFDIPLEKIMDHNVDKLTARYGTGRFTSEASINRES